jgi:DNA (cytosine-5)-methyltransferase 1
MVDRFEAAGLHLAAEVHNMADFGVPQERFRALLVATAGVQFHLKPPRGASSLKTVRDAIGSLPEVAPGAQSSDPMHFCANHRKSTIDVIRQVPKDGGNRPPGVGPACLSKVDGYRDVYGRLSWDKPAVTITASARNPASGRFSHPEQDRGLTVREAALLQGFPKDYWFDGSFDDKFLQIGNAVPPVFSQVLAKSILKYLTGEKGLLAKNRLAHSASPASRPQPLPNSFSSAIFALKHRTDGATRDRA